MCKTRSFLGLRCQKFRKYLTWFCCFITITHTHPWIKKKQFITYIIVKKYLLLSRRKKMPIWGTSKSHKAWKPWTLHSHGSPKRVRKHTRSSRGHARTHNILMQPTEAPLRSKAVFNFFWVLMWPQKCKENTRKFCGWRSHIPGRCSTNKGRVTHLHKAKYFWMVHPNGEYVCFTWRKWSWKIG